MAKALIPLQGKVVFANNGEHIGGGFKGYEDLLIGGEATGDESGALVEWDGKDSFTLIERKQFTDVTGPGGIYGAIDNQSPLWTMGWDKRSVILKVLDRQQWKTYRIPKGSHTFDPRHGWYTEWPRIREVDSSKFLMVMHGSMFEFPQNFKHDQTAGIKPIATHLRYIPDFTYWNGHLVLAADDASSMQNPLVGQPQSNLWFGSREQLHFFGPTLGWGGIWVEDSVQAGQLSEPLLISTYTEKSLFLSNHGESTVNLTLELDEFGDDTWTSWQNMLIPAGETFVEIIPSNLKAEWLRITPKKDGVISAYLHYYSQARISDRGKEKLAGIASADEQPLSTGIVRPAGHNRSLQYLDQNGKYWEIHLNEDQQDLDFVPGDPKQFSAFKDIGSIPIEAVFKLDSASVIWTHEDGKQYRLPKTSKSYDRAFEEGWPRAIREAVSERYLANIHGIFYEIPRSEGAGNHVPDIQKIKAVSTHKRRILDFCTWRGLMVLSGISPKSVEDGQVFKGSEGQALWFGMIDDLWQFGKAVGKGGPWYDSDVAANQWSDPYLMTGFDQKTLRIKHSSTSPIMVDIGINYYHNDDFFEYTSLKIPVGEEITYKFPDGFHAHWVKLRTDKDTKITAIFTYE